MSVYQGATTAYLPLSVEERERVLEQLNRLLDTNHFKNSRRYPTLLRFIVEETLEGRGEFLKERLLGVRVFDRPADYDTAADPVVRVTIAEIRKRIAQYYHDEEHDSELRIELLPGSYAPEFRFRNTRNDLGAPLHPSALILPGQDTAPNPARAPSSAPDFAVRPSTSRAKFVGKLMYGLAVPALVLLGLFAAPVARWLHPSALDELWAPVLASQQPVLFCVPTDVGKNKDTQAGFPTMDASSPGRREADGNSDISTFLAHEALGENVVYSDMLATLRMANVLDTRHRDYRVKLNVYTNLEDLREGPAILIGGLDNQWTMRALAPLRFHFAGSDEDRYWIADSKNLGNRNWSLDLKQQYQQVTRDYAIIARLHNDQTGQPQIIVAGIGMSGTAAAGEFIGDAQRVEELRRRLGPGFKDHDFEIVLSTDVVNGLSGSPKIIAAAVL